MWLLYEAFYALRNQAVPTRKMVNNPKVSSEIVPYVPELPEEVVSSQEFLTQAVRDVASGHKYHVSLAPPGFAKRVAYARALLVEVAVSQLQQALSNSSFVPAQELASIAATLAKVSSTPVDQEHADGARMGPTVNVMLNGVRPQPAVVDLAGEIK